MKTIKINALKINFKESKEISSLDYADIMDLYLDKDAQKKQTRMLLEIWDILAYSEKDREKIKNLNFQELPVFLQEFTPLITSLFENIESDKKKSIAKSKSTKDIWDSQN